jgi:hypothetical protein
MDGGAFAAVEHTKLYARAVGAPRHFPAKGIKLADEMPFASPANRRVARQIAHCVKVYRKADGFHAKAGGGERGFNPSVPRANNSNIKLSSFKNHIAFPFLVPIRFSCYEIRNNMNDLLLLCNPHPREVFELISSIAAPAPTCDRTTPYCNA